MNDGTIGNCRHHAANTHDMGQGGMMHGMAKQGDQKENVTVRMDPELIAALDKIAERQERTRSQVIGSACREYAERHGQQKPAGKAK